MSDQRPSRKKVRPGKLKDFRELSNSDPEGGVAEERSVRPPPRRRGRPRGQISATGASKKNSLSDANSISQVNSAIINTGVQYAQAVKGKKQVSAGSQKDHSVSILQGAAASTPVDVASSITAVSKKNSPSDSNSISKVNSVIDNTGVLNAQTLEGEPQVSAEKEKDHSIGFIQAAVASTQEDVASFMHSTKRTLAAIFTVLTMTQLRELEIVNEQEIVDNNLLKHCVTEAKSAVKIRIGVYKDNLDKAKNKQMNEQNWTKVGGGNTKPSEANPECIAQQGTITENSLPNTVQEKNKTKHSDNKNKVSSAELDWKKKYDENRKRNIILEGVWDENNRTKDMNIVENILNYLGCDQCYQQLTYVTRLGQRRIGRNRLMMICFTNEITAKKVLQRSPELRHNGNFKRIFLKKDLPRDQRAGAKRRIDNVAAEAIDNTSEYSAEVPTFSNSSAEVPTNANNNRDPDSDHLRSTLSIITSESDWEGDGEYSQGDTNEDTYFNWENWVIVDEAMGDDEACRVERGMFEDEASRVDRGVLVPTMVQYASEVTSGTQEVPTPQTVNSGVVNRAGRGEGPALLATSDGQEAIGTAVSPDRRPLRDEGTAIQIEASGLEATSMAAVNEIGSIGDTQGVRGGMDWGALG